MSVSCNQSQNPDEGGGSRDFIARSSGGGAVVKIEVVMHCGSNRLAAGGDG